MAARRLASLVLTLAILLSLGLVACEDEGPGRPPDETITVAQPGPDAVVQADADHELEADEQAEATLGTRPTPPGPGDLGPSEPLVPGSFTPDVHEDTVDETPPGIDAAEVAAGKRESERLARDQLAPPEDPAGAEAHSCPAAHVVNQSALSQRRVGVALHFTVSAPGSLNAIRGLFNRPSFGASSNYGIELFGRCQQWVPEGRKAWTQGAANSAYVSIEIVTFNLTRAQWLASPIVRNGILASLVRDIAKRQGAPIRLVDPVGCNWTPGITDHDRLECGNTHWDVGKNFPWDVFIRQVRQGVPKPLPVRYQRRCSELNKLARSAARRRKAHKSPLLTARQHARRSELRRSFEPRKRGVRCTARGAVRS